MSSTDGERIAPVTYLFRSRAEEAGSEDADRSPSVLVQELQAQELQAQELLAHELPVQELPAQESTVLAAIHESSVHGSTVKEAAALRTPMFVDLGEPEAADERAMTLRTELEREARAHVVRDIAEAAAPARKGSFAPINNVSMHALARRGMSSREMHDYLLGREFEPGAVDDEVERLESVALLDDVALGETLVRTLRDRKGLGRSALTAELRRRHLDATAIEIALEGLDDDELERATEIAHKRAGQLRSYDAETAKRRLSAFLMRKGYSGSVVSTAVQRALAPAGPSFR